MRNLVSATGRLATAVADRMVAKVVPHTVARATFCDWECCFLNGWWQYCCYYPNGHVNCGGCARSSYC